MNCQDVGIRWNRMRSHREPSQHSGMVITHFFPEIVINDLMSFVCLDRQIRGGHPINKITFENCRVTSDDAPAIGMRKQARVWQGSEQILYGLFDVFSRPDTDVLCSGCNSTLRYHRGLLRFSN